MSAKITRTLILAAAGLCVLALSCSDDNPQSSDQPRIVGDPAQPAQLLSVQLPEDCGDGLPFISSLSGKINNVDLNAVKIVMYSSAGAYYGTIRVFNNDGTFSMDLPCDRRVRLLLTLKDWTPTDVLDSGPPALDNTILAAYWDIDRVLGKVDGAVLDAYNNAALEGVAITWQDSGVTYYDTTGSGGYFSGAEGLSSGIHVFEFELAGYAGLITEITVPTIDDVRDGPNDYPGDVIDIQALDISLPPLSAELTGTVYAIDPGTTDTLPADDIQVVLTPSEGLQPASYDTTTNASGDYDFEEAPAAVTVTVSLPSFDRYGQSYGPVDTSLTLWPGMTYLDFILDSGGGAAIRIEQPETAR